MYKRQPYGATVSEGKEAPGSYTHLIAEYVAAGREGSIVPTALNMAPVPPEVMDAVGPLSLIHKMCIRDRPRAARVAQRRLRDGRPRRGCRS